MTLLLLNGLSKCKTNCLKIHDIFSMKWRFKADFARSTEGQPAYSRYYALLGIPDASDQESVRKAFLELVKRYHPDSGSSDSNKEKFHEIETAYRKLQEKFSSERWNVNEGLGEYGLYYEEKDTTKEVDIQHTAPQHRQYLSYEGYGHGSPQQREKQYQKMRAATAIENVYSHRLAKIPQGDESSLVIKNKKEAKKIRTTSEMERLVEDLIQESMSRGDFDNLSGSGKPLTQKNINPYVDFVTHKLNQVLIENGFTPEWIVLQKEIHQEKQRLRREIEKKRMLLGYAPLSGDEAGKWSNILSEFKDQVVTLNKKINRFNLQVPLLNKQMVFFQLEREAQQILETGSTKHDVTVSPAPAKPPEEGHSLLNLLQSLLLGKTWGSNP